MAPSGWPIAMAPPLGFTLAGSRSSTSQQYVAWTAVRRNIHAQPHAITYAITRAHGSYLLPALCDSQHGIASNVLLSTWQPCAGLMVA